MSVEENKSIYLLLGPEEGEKLDFIEKIKKSIQTTHHEKPEIHRIYPFDSKMADVLDLLTSGSLFSSHRLVILNNIEEMSKKQDFNLLIKYCKDPVKDATLLLLSPFIKDMDTKLKRLIPKENRIVFWELFPDQKVGWIVNFFKKKNVKISLSAAGMLLEMVENNTRDLRMECEKLISFFGSGSALQEEDIEKYIFHSKEENVFTLFRKIAQKDFQGSLEVLHTIRLAGEIDALQVVSGLLWQFRKLLSFKRLEEKNYAIHEIYRNLQITSKKRQKMYLEAHNNFKIGNVKLIVLIISEFDLRLRTIKAEFHSLVLELFLYYIVVQGGKGFWRRV